MIIIDHAARKRNATLLDYYMQHYKCMFLCVYLGPAASTSEKNLNLPAFNLANPCGYTKISFPNVLQCL